MKLVRRVCALVITVAVVVFAQEPHTYRQRVRDFPTGHDTTGINWYTYDLYNMIDANDYLDRNSAGSYVSWSEANRYTVWWAECGNFNHWWKNGDTIITIGSWDSRFDELNGDTAVYNNDEGHRGYYFLYSDTMDATVILQTWKPDDTLRRMPMFQPCAWPSGDSIIGIIENPYETNRPPWGSQEYDVLGYWLVASHTSAAPNAMRDIGFFPVQGGPGDITTYTYFREYFDTYNAYYIVTRPETTSTPGVCPGFRTHFMSEAGWVHWSGIEDARETATSSAISVVPILNYRAMIKFMLPKQAHVALKLYNVAGQCVESLISGVMSAGEHSVTFDASKLSSGIHFYQFETDEKTISGKLIVVR